jgi:hypothetical protein
MGLEKKNKPRSKSAKASLFGSSSSNPKHLEDFHVLFSEVASRRNFSVVNYRSLRNVKLLREKYTRLADKKTSGCDDDEELYYMHHAIIFDYRNVRLYVRMVDLLLERHDFKKALYYAERLKLVSKENSFLLKGRIFFSMNETDQTECEKNLIKSKRNFEKANLANKKDNVFDLGLVNFSLKNYDESEKNFRKCISIENREKPSTPEHQRNREFDKNSLFMLGTIQMVFKNYESAINEFVCLLELEQHFTMDSHFKKLVYYHIAICFYMKNDLDRAMAFCNHGLALVRKCMNLFRLKAAIFLKQKAFEQLEQLQNKINRLVDNEFYDENRFLIEYNLAKINNYDEPNKYNLLIEQINRYIERINDKNEPEAKKIILDGTFNRLLYYKCIFLYLKMRYDEDNSLFDLLEEHKKYEAIFILDQDLVNNGKKHVLNNFALSNYTYLIGALSLMSNNDSLSVSYLDRALELEATNVYFIKAKIVYYLKKSMYKELNEFLLEHMNRFSHDIELINKLKFYLAYSYVFTGESSKAAAELNDLLPLNLRNKSIAEAFCDNDLKYETVMPKLYSDIRQSYNHVECMEPYVCYNERQAIKDIYDLNFTVKLQLNVNFKFKNALYLLFKVILNIKQRLFIIF